LKDSKIIDKLDELTLETDMLTEIMDAALRQHEEKEGITSISFLSGKIRKKFRKIRALF
jgi:hypothetical protein